MHPDTVGRPLEILFVEDSISDAGLAMIALNEGGVKQHTTLVRDGEEAMEFLHQEGRFRRAPRPDLILLDLGLPKKDGRQVLFEIKDDPSLSTIPVVIMTGSTGYFDELRGMEMHVDGYINKPVDLDNFIEVVKKLKRYLHESIILPEGV